MSVDEILKFVELIYVGLDALALDRRCISIGHRINVPNHVRHTGTMSSMQIQVESRSLAAVAYDGARANLEVESRSSPKSSVLLEIKSVEAPESSLADTIPGTTPGS